MPSRQKKYLRQQAILRADEIRRAQAKEAEQKAVTEGTDAMSPPLDLKTTSKPDAPARKTLLRKIAVPRGPSEGISTGTRKMVGAQVDNSIVTEGRNVKKALARKKKAHHIPLLERKRADSDEKLHPLTRTAPMHDQKEGPPESTLYDMVDHFSVEYLELPESKSPQLPTGSESTLQSVDGFSEQFSFEVPRPVLTNHPDSKAQSLFKIPPPAPVAEDSSSIVLGEIEGFNPTFTFTTPQSMSASSMTPPEFSKSPLGQVALFQHVTEKTSTVTMPLVSASTSPVAGAFSVDIAADLEAFASPDSSASTTDVESLVTNCADIYPAALGRPTDILTSKLVAFGYEIASTAYNVDAQRSYVAADTDLHNLYACLQDIDLDAELEVTAPSGLKCENEHYGNNFQASAGRQAITPSSELTSGSSDDGECRDVPDLEESYQHRVFMTDTEGQCLVVSATDRPHSATVINEQESDNMFVASSHKSLGVLSDDSDETVPFLPEDDAGDAKVSLGEYTDSPCEFDSPRVVVPPEDGNCSASSIERDRSHKWLVLTSPPTPALSTNTPKPITAATHQNWLVLSPSFVALRSEMTNSSPNIDQYPSLSYEPALEAFRPSSPQDAFSERSSVEELSADDVFNTNDEDTVLMTSPDWTAELVRTTLGTESLFTFLSILNVNGDGSMTKIALVSTFLILVASEREKLGLPALPASWTASAILASKVLPHTTVLGTTSLAIFLDQFDFGGDSTVRAEEIYRVFKDLCKEETRRNLQATTGIMGVLGRSLGKLASA